MPKRPVVRSLGIIGETTSGQLAASEVVTETLAADAFSGARFVTAVAGFHVLGLIALHGDFLPSSISSARGSGFQPRNLGRLNLITHRG
jgi:hypothetical protein